MTLENRLNNMIGKNFMYKTHVHKIVNYKITAETVIIGTDKEVFVFLYKDINKNLQDFLQVEDEPENNTAVTIFTQNAALDFINEIKLNINDIKKDVKNIDKAKAINECLNTLINFGRLQVETAKLNKNRG